MALDINERVDTIMSSSLVTLHPSDTLADVKKTFETHSFHHIPIVKFREVIGIVSKSDLEYHERHYDDLSYGDMLEKDRLASYTVEEVMTKGLATLPPEAPILDALELFKENVFHCVPIVSNGELQGIVTTHDVICALTEV